MATFQTVAKASSLPPGSSARFEVLGKKIALFNVDGSFYALEDNCNHRGGPLSEGPLEGCIVTCPWHGAQFDVTTGAKVRPPAMVDMKSFPVQVQGDDVLIGV